MSEVAHFDADDQPELHEILRRVLAGEEVLIEEAGRPLAQVIPFRRPGDHPATASSTSEEPRDMDFREKRRRMFGSMKGQIVLADDWDSDETNEAIARDFYDSKIFPE